MNVLNRMMSYDKTKNENQEQCNCTECIGINNVSEKKEIIENFRCADDFLRKIENYQMMCKEKEFLTILNLRYWYKDKKTKTFIWKSLFVHGDKYDYHNTIYVKAIENVEINCRIENHGTFLQTPHKHLNKRGCQICGGTKNLTLDEFIEKAVKKHGDKYDYSKMVYKNTRTKVCIICKEHNKDYEFWQTPNHHLRGEGCPICGNERVASYNRLTLEEFIKRAKEIHGNKYDYSKVNYINGSTKVCIICKNHENYEFWQRPSEHIKNQGCPICGLKKRTEEKFLTLEEFIKRAKEIHGNKYDYSKSIYNGYHNLIEIICPIHDSFWQRPNNHLSNQGCPKCRSSKGEIIIRNFLIKNEIKFEEQKRFNDCRCKNPLPFDFYIPQYNLCIEFDGIQHFIPQDFTSSLTEKEKLEKFKNLKFRDKIKNDYCENNNINLLRIKYNENIEEKLIKYFQKYKF